MKPYDTHLRDWIDASPTLSKWYRHVAAKAKSAAGVYASCFYGYWSKHLSQRFPSVDAWVEEVRTQHKSDDLEYVTRQNQHSQPVVSSRDKRVHPTCTLLCERGSRSYDQWKDKQRIPPLVKELMQVLSIEVERLDNQE